MQNILNETWLYYERLVKIMKIGNKNGQTLNKLFLDLKSIYDNFTRQMQNLAEGFHNEISKETADENDSLIVCYQYLSNYILKLTSNSTNFSRNLQAEIIEPFNMVLQNFSNTNKDISSSTSLFLKNIETSVKNSKKWQDKYYKSSRAVEKSEEVLDKIKKKTDKTESYKEELSKASNNMTKLKIEVQSNENGYKTALMESNKNWANFDSRLLDYFHKFDSNNESRASFSRFSINRVIKLFTHFNPKFEDISEEKLKEQEEKFLNVPQESVLKLIMKGKQSIFLNLVKKEEFLSYENWKKYQDLSFYVEPITMEQKYREFSDTIFKLLQMDSFEITRRKSDNINEEKMKAQDGLRKKSIDLEKLEKNTTVTVKWIEMEEKLSFYLPNDDFRKVFLEFLAEQLKEKSYLSMNHNSFLRIINIFKDLIKYEQERKYIDYETLYNILLISSRIYEQNEKRFSEYLSTYISNFAIWEQNDFWEKIFLIILEKKSIFLEKKKQAESAFNLNNFNKMLKDFLKNTKQMNEVQMTEKDIKLLALEELNFLMININLKSELAIDFLIDMAQKNHLDYANMIKLLEKQENKRFSDLRKNFEGGTPKNQSRKMKLHKDLDEYKELYPIKRALAYLSVADQPIKLLAVCKSWKQSLRKKVSKIYLIKFQNEKVLKNHRVPMWLTFLIPEKIEINYLMLKSQLKNNTNQVDQIIGLDVQRSLFLHHEKIDQKILEDLLKVYAFNNSEVSYCQGMNYIMGFLYHNIREESTTYLFFNVILEKYFSKMFGKEFAQLKLLFYQFDRCLALFMPELSEHLKLERLDSSFFTAPWFLTVFTNVFQYTLDSYILNQIWDVFVCEGWKGIFKACIFILKNYENKILAMSFDDILNFLTDIPKSELFRVSFSETEMGNIKEEHLFLGNLKKEIVNIKITNSLLKNLENDYDKCISKISRKLEYFKH